MGEASPRVALLARPGEACERIREALDAIGAQVVLVGDPTEVAPEAVGQSAARAVVIALDPATENALDRFDGVLDAPELQVLYEESDLVVRREGWEAARWRRHLAAKLLGHGDVLPPMPEGSGTAADATPPARSGADAPVPSAAAEAVAGLELERFDMRLPEPHDAGAALSFDPVAAEYEYDGGDLAMNLDLALPEVDTSASDFAIELDTSRAPVDNSGLVDLAFDDLASAPAAAQATPAPVEREDATFATLDLEADGPVAVDSEARRNQFNVELAELERRIAGLSLVDEHVPREDNGAVVVLAGIGGPDAVRQLLGALPAGFPRPVLVRQRLDGGRYDRLVAQMQRVSAMPVKLAEPGQRAEAGVVYILPPEIGLQVDPSGRVFTDRGGDVFAALPAPDSALLLLSGSDPQAVDGALAGKAGGAFVAGQSPEGCFDSAAIDALMARGGDTATPPDLAARLVERWRDRASFGDGT